MSFVDSDEYIIVLDNPIGGLSIDDLKRLREIGIKTCWASGPWYLLEPRRGEYQWRLGDFIVERMAAAGMKLLFMAPSVGPTFAPDDWYLRTHDGHIWRAYYDGYRDGWPYSELSPWCAEAMAYERQFQRTLLERYGGEAVQLIPGTVHGGEAILPGMVESWFDRHALDSFRTYAESAFAGDLVYFNKANHTLYERWEDVQPALFPNRAAMERHPTTTDWLHDTLLPVMLDRYAAYAEQPAPETWVCLPQRDTEFAERVETGPRTGNWMAAEIYRTFPDKLNATLQVMLFEAYRTDGTQGIFEYVRGYEDVTWVGSQFIQGLLRHTSSAIAQGLRGFLTGPLHPDSGCNKLTPEMVNAMSWSIEQWKAARA